MANIPSNTAVSVVSGSGTITGSFSGFTVAQAVTFNGMKDINGNNLATTSSVLTFASGVTIPVYITSASISAGAVLFYS
jgi:hypothetical protein